MKRPLLILVLFSLPVFVWLFWQYLRAPETLSSTLESFDKAGEETKKDLSHIPSLPVTEDEDSFILQDDGQTGLSITYADQGEGNRFASEDTKDILSLSFPKDRTGSIGIKLDEERTITIEDLKNQGNLSFKKVMDDPIADESFFRKLFKKTDQGEVRPTYLVSTDQRKTLLYTFQKDHATNEKKLKSWTLYAKGNGLEEEAYRFTDAKIKIDDDGNAEVFYFGEKDIRNQQAQADVEPSLFERARRVVEKDVGEDILSGDRAPDFLIPKPYFYDRNGDIHETDWKYDEENNTLSLQISIKDDLYPLALDPTLAFTVPAQSNTGWVTTGRSVSTYFGDAMVSGDFNADGKTDLAVGAGSDASNGRVYIFYNDGFIPESAVAADVTLSGSGLSDAFGYTLAAGDFDFDGRTDLAVGSYYNDFVSIFYNDGSMPTTSAAADVTITGLAGNHSFGIALSSGDWNADGRTDLAVGASGISSSAGSVYVFYNDGSIPTVYSSADVTITGGASGDLFGSMTVAGDWNADGRTDLAVGASGYSTNTGRVYLFYNDGSIPTTAATADVIITGGATSDLFGTSLVSGDWNADGKTDLAVGASGYSSSTGRAYIFYNDGSIPTTAATADVTITGEGAGAPGFGFASSTADLNADGRIDLVISAKKYTTDTGRAYIFYNDGSIPTTAATADVMITGEVASGNFGASLVCGDFNFDGKMDLAVGANGYVSGTGRVYIFASQNGQVNTNVNLVGEATNNNFGYAMVSGDFNFDGRVDLVIGSYGYSSSTGRAYIFYNDGSIPTTAATADVIITGEASSSFGNSFASGDWNADGRIDLVVGAYNYSSATGRAYIFYNDGSIPTTAATADVIITGETTNNYFGYSLASGDFNADGKTDLAVGASGYSTNTGRVYLFYNDGSIPTTAATADVIITGESGYFGYSLNSGDFNVDGKTDLVVGSFYYSSSTGRAYIFYNDGSIPTTAATADVIITGESNSSFGISLSSGDWNADGKTDLVVGADGYSTGTGRVYLFYNDGSIPTTAATADVIITGETTSDLFGTSLVSGDWNADGKTDLAVGASGYSTNTGCVYLFYNDGSIPTTAATADVIITGETTSNFFGTSLVSGDWNADGRTDLAVGAYGYSTNTGRAYIYETRDNFAWQLQSVPSLTGGLRTNPSFSGQELKMTGEAGTGKFGGSMISGDWNADGRTDLVVGASGYSTNTGRAYIFYNDGHLAPSAVNADVVITGAGTNNYFGFSFASGDFNADGRVDLAIGAYGAASNAGRAYLFYNDGSIPVTAATADLTITGTSSNDFFAWSLASGDFNADGKTDLAAGAYYATAGTSTGISYLFYNDGSIPTTAATADVTITGETSSSFGWSLASGDFNADGKTDLAVGAQSYSTNTGRAYIFYNDGSIPTTAATADVIITGEGTTQFFGSGMTAGDLNADGKVDLVVGAYFYSAATGRAYIFYNDGSIPTTAATADVKINGAGNSDFGDINGLITGDFNGDSRIDLAVSGRALHGDTVGKTYLFYNDGSIPTTAATADVTITGETTGNSFGTSLASGDWNADGRTDLAVGATGYSSSRGRAYVYTFNDGMVTGETTNNYFGTSLASGDWNADGRTDLAVGAKGYSTNTGRVYIFYNDGSVPTTAATADVVITGETTNNYFGYSLASGDFNADGKTDLAAGAYGYSSNIGRAYLFYNDGSIPTTAATADVIITATNYDSFGISLTAGDLNADGKTDIIAGAYGYSGGTGTGRAYIFYADGTNNFGTAACTGSAPTACSVGNADVIITGESSSQFGNPLTSGDFNADGKTDLVVGAFVYSTNIGRAYIFYNDGSIPTTAATADVIITGEASSNFGVSLTSGDFNADGKTDLAVGAFIYSTSTGRAYIFYNDGSIPTTAATADIIITGETTSSYFGRSLASGDWNADSKTDLAVGAYGYSSSIGRVYIFYNDGSIPTAAASADVITTGQTTSNYFGYSLASGDFNADGKTDLAVGAQGYSTNTGRVYIFITEAKSEESVRKLKSKGVFKAKGSYKVK